MEESLPRTRRNFAMWRRSLKHPTQSAKVEENDSYKHS
jgi:hypothetical protein